MKKLLLIVLAIPCLADSPHFGPTYDSARTNLEFRNVYQAMPDKAATPRIYTGAGAPTFAPIKAGDEYIDTTNRKVYFSTAAATSASWAVVN